MRPNPESGEQQAQATERTAARIKPEYTELAEQDRMASMIMSAVYSSDHIDFTPKLQIEPSSKLKQTLARADELKERVRIASEAYAGDYGSARIIYRAHAEPKPPKPGRGAEREPVGATVTEMFYDTAAVIQHKDTLYVAFNYKVRKMGDAEAKTNVPVEYESFAEIGPHARENLQSMLQTELANHDTIRRVQVLRMNPAPRDEGENALPHAEMQLVKYLQDEEIIHPEDKKELNKEAGFRVGVSKPCCVRCAEVLDKLEIERPRWTASPMDENSKPKWKAPAEIGATEDFDFPIPHADVDPLERRSSQDQNPECEAEGHPVAPVTGESFDHFIDHEQPGDLPFRWIRHYRSGESDRRGPVGRGFRHTCERSLTIDYARAIYTDDRGRDVELFLPRPGEPDSHAQGYTLRTEQEGERLTCVLARIGEPTMEFVEERRGAPVRFARLRAGKSRMELRHDALGRLIGMTETSETGTLETRLSLDSEGRVLEVRRGSAKGSDLPVIAAYTYDENGCLTRARDAAGAECLYSYDAAGRMTSSTDRNGYTFHYRYDEQGRCVETFGEDGLYGVELQYEPEARRTRTVRSNGAVWIYDYDVNNTIVRVTDPYGGVRRRVPDASGRIVQEIGPGKRTLRFLHDAAGGDAGVVDRFGYIHPPLDVEPNPEDPLADKIPATPWEQQWGPSIEVFTPTEMPMEGVPAGDVSPVVRRKRTVEERDILQRPTVESDAAGSKSTLAYDAAGNVTAYLDRDGREHTHQIASWNLVAAAIDPLGQATRYGYTPAGRIAQIVDAGGSESRYEYDHKDRLVRVHRHGALREEYEYDRGDRLIEKRDRDGQRLLQCVNADNGLPLERVLASGDVQRFRYDERGEMVWARSSGVEITRAFDVRRRLVRDEREGVGVTCDYRSIDVWRTTYLGRFVVEHRREKDGSLVIVDPTGGLHRVRRRERGLVTATLGNGTSVRSTYDHEGLCLRRDVWRPSESDAVRRSLRYSYSPEGELSRVEDSQSGTTEHLYDAAHRLIGVKGREGMSIRLDRAGNILEKPGLLRADFIEGNRLRASGRERFRYDERHRLAEIAATTGESTRFEYNSLDLLIRVTSRPSDADRRSGSGSEPPAWTASYDGLCRRIHKTVGDRRTDFYWEGDRLAAEIGPTGAVRIYVYPAPGALVPLLFIDYESGGADPAKGRVYYPIGDQIGAPLFIEDQDGQVVWSAARVEPYGGVTVSPEARIAYNLRFPGHYHDEETGLHDNRHRSYSPRLGRYLQPDPAGQSGGTNLYAYPANPLVEVDVLGRMQNHVRQTGEGSGGAAEKPGIFSRIASKLRRERTTQEKIDDILKKNPQITVIASSMSGEPETLLADLERYVRGDLELYRGIQQWHRSFPADMGSLERIMPKVPGSQARPDFTDNENAWLPMAPDYQISQFIAVRWSDEATRFFGRNGEPDKPGIDPARPVALIWTRRIRPHEEIAFCMDGEVQIKGPVSADKTKLIMLDDDLGIFHPQLAGETFRLWATQRDVKIQAP